MKKSVYLFLALLLPILIFLFLKFFGRNEFAVKPLYTIDQPVVLSGCPAVSKVPYLLPDSVLQRIASTDSLTVIFFGSLKNEDANQMARVKEETTNDPISIKTMDESARATFLRRCVFFLDQSNTVIMFDSKGNIRGAYPSIDRKEMDRLLTEITIILKKY